MKNNLIKIFGKLIRRRSVLEKFEAEYQKQEEAERKSSDNFFDVNAKDASEMARTNPEIPEYNQTYLEEIIRRIVKDLCDRTYGFRIQNGIMEDLFHERIGEDQEEVTVEDLKKIPERIRPQLTGTLQQNDLNESSGEFLIQEYKKFLTEKDMQKKMSLYGHFRQGLEILDIDPLVYEALGRNKNNMGYWLPYIAEAAAKHGFFKIPDTTLVKVPPTLLQLTRLEYTTLNPATLKIVDDWAMQVFDLDVSKDYFIKTGIFSSKFDFRNAKVSGEKEVRELGEYLVFIQNYATMLAGPLVTDAEGKPISHYGAATTNEFVVREYIKDKEENLCIYNGMPLHTEYRVFIELDGNGWFEILGASPYWRKDVMLQRFSQGPDKDTAKMMHDFLVYSAHEKTLYERYDENVDRVLEHVREMAPDIRMKGQWSLDIMQNGDDFYIIDMATASTSALSDCVPKGRIRKEEEHWLPEELETAVLEEK